MAKDGDTVSPRIYEHISRGALIASVIFLVGYAISGVLIFLVGSPADAMAQAALYLAAFLPMICGLALGAYQIYLKWVRYTFGERHVQVPLVGMVLSVVMLVAGYFWLFGEMSSTSLFFFPLAQFSVSLIAIGYPMTHPHKLAGVSMLTSSVPVLLFFVLTLYGWFAGADVGFGTPILAVLYLFSGVLMGLSGSLHHMGTITTSFVRVERVVDVDEGEVERLRGVIRSRDEELHSIERFGESLKSLTLENYKSELHAGDDDPPSLMAVKMGVSALIRNVKEDAVKGTLSVEEVERLAMKERLLQKKEGELEQREKELLEKTAEISRRANEVEKREMDVKRIEDDLDLRKREAEMKVQEVRSGEERARLSLREVELRAEEVKRQTETLKEKEVALESAAKDLEARETALREREDKIMRTLAELGTKKDRITTRESELAERERELNAKEEALNLKERELSAMPLGELKQMQDEINVKESEFQQKDAEIRVLRAKLDEAQRSLQARVEEIQRIKADYEGSRARLREREHELARREEEARILQIKMETRERELRLKERELEKRIADASRAAMEERPPVVLERLKMAREMEASPGRAVRSGEGVVSPFPGDTSPEHQKDKKPTSDLADAIMRASLLESTGERSGDRMPTGIPRMDDLLSGGIPQGAIVLLPAQAYAGGRMFLRLVVSHCLARGIPTVYLTTTQGVDDVVKDIKGDDKEVRAALDEGAVKWIDTFSPSPVPVPFIEHVRTLPEKTPFKELVLLVEARLANRGLLVIDSASPLISRGIGHFEDGFLRDVGACLKRVKGVGLLLVDAGSHTDQDIDRLRGRVHATISFRKVGAKTSLLVEGIPGTRSNDWVEYSFEGGEMNLGSFSLERIR